MRQTGEMSAAQIAFDMELGEAFECRENECREETTRERLFSTPPRRLISRT